MATFDSKWRFDPAKGGVYDSSLDDEDKPDVPAISADTSAMPDDSPTAFSVGSGGTSAPPPAPSAPAAPTPAAAAGETFGIPNTTTPLTLTGDTSHTNVTRKVTTAQDALAQGAMANAAEEQVGSLRTQGELEAKQKLDEAGTHEQRKGVYEANNKLRSTAIQETEAQKSLLATKAATLQKVIDGTKITDGWSDERMGSRVPAVLGLILNGIGRGLSGNHGPDELFASLQERIARDHAEQIRKLDKLKAEVAHLTGPAREQAEKELKLKLDNIEAQQIGQLARVSEEGNALAARTGSPLVIAKMGEKMGEVKAKAAEKQQDFLDKTRTEIQSGSAHENKQVIPSASAAVPPDTTVLDLSGKPIGRGRSLIEAEKLRDQQGKANQLLTALEDLKTHVLEHGRTDIGGVIPLDTQAVRAERENKIKEINGQLSALYAEGVLSEAEFKRSSGGLNTGVLKNGEAAAAGIDSIINSVGHAYNAHARAKAVLAPGANPANRSEAPAASPAAPAPSRPAPAAGSNTKTLSNGKIAHKVNGQWVIED
jgi:hypothetical protein